MSASSSTADLNRGPETAGASPWARWALGVVLAAVAVAALWRWYATTGQDLTPLRWGELQPPAQVAMRPWRHIVLHHSATRGGTVAGLDQAHRRNGWDGIGYHFVIGNGAGMRLGAVEPTFRWRTQREGAHAGGGLKGRPYNQEGIGICLIGQFQEGAPDAWQEERLAQLLAELIRHVPTLSVTRIIGHGEVPGKDTYCPGKHLDIERVRYRVRRLLAGDGGV